MKYLSLSIPGYGQVDSELPAGVPTGGLFKPDGEMGGAGINTIQAVVVFIIVFAVFFGLWSTFKGSWDMITSRGVKEKFHKGRDRVLYTLFGFLLIFLAFLLMGVASAAFGVNLLPFISFK